MKKLKTVEEAEARTESQSERDGEMATERINVGDEITITDRLGRIRKGVIAYSDGVNVSAKTPRTTGTWEVLSRHVVRDGAGKLAVSIR